MKEEEELSQYEVSKRVTDLASEILSTCDDQDPSIIMTALADVIGIIIINSIKNKELIDPFLEDFIQIIKDALQRKFDKLRKEKQ